MAVPAQMVLKNGTVWTGAGADGATAVALWGGKVLATGSDDALDGLIGPATKVEARDGELTGLLAEYGRDPIKKVLPAPTDDDLVAAIERAGTYLNSLGITSCMDAAVGMHSHFREIGAYFRADRDRRLPVRTYLCLLGAPGPKNIVPDCHRAGLVTGVGHDRLRVGPVKIFTDGSAGGRTACHPGRRRGVRPARRGGMTAPVHSDVARWAG